MQDVALGQERVRVWPRKRGRAKTKAQREANDKFRVAQMCCNYVAPQIYLWAHEARKGTPLLTRDLLNMMLYNRLLIFDLEDGRTLTPMTGITDVSASLDVLGKDVGSTLMRTPDGWRAVPASQQSLIGADLRRPTGFVSATDGNLTPVTWTAAPIDQGSYFDPGAPTVLTLPASGWYAASLTTDATSGTGSFRQLLLEVNGITVGREYYRLGATGPNNWLTLACMFWGNAGEDAVFSVGASGSIRQWTSTRATILYL
jgi:hypothetical protein